MPRNQQRGASVLRGARRKWEFLHKKQEGSRKKRFFLREPLSSLLGFLMLVVGLAFLLYPLASDVIAQVEVSNTLAELYALETSVTDDAADDSAAEDVSASDAASSDDGSSSSGIGNASDAAKAASETYQKLVAYNELVRTGQAGAINDPFGFSSTDLEAWGLSSGIIGQVDIPAMGVSLPLYLGATTANMRLGATVVAGTSVPLGEEDSNCVIAAHRASLSGLAMFRDIEKLEIGDLITITTLWDTLVYEVVSMQAVTPDDVEAVGVQEGRDMITLLTCHPYGYNTYRMLVFCERVVDAEPQTTTLVQKLITKLTPDLSSSSPLLVAEQLLRLVGLGILVALGVVLILRSIMRLRRWRKEGPQEKPPPSPPSSSPPSLPGSSPPSSSGSSRTSRRRSVRPGANKDSSQGQPAGEES